MNRSATLVHATSVAVDGRAILILGPSGVGKSALALELITRGATLVADDRTCVETVGTQIIASAPDSIAGLIEAREVGLLHVAHAGPTPVALVVDLSQHETARLPNAHVHDLQGVTLPCLHKSGTGHFPSAVLLYIKDKKRFPDV